jgi:hypothetical protein
MTVFPVIIIELINILFNKFFFRRDRGQMKIGNSSVAIFLLEKGKLMRVLKPASTWHTLDPE